MKFFRRTAGCTLFDHKRNAEILENLQVESVDEKLRKYKYNWLWHVTRMNNNNRMPRIMLNYRPNRWRRFGRTLKGLLNEAETGLWKPNSWRMMMVMMMMMMNTLLIKVNKCFGITSISTPKWKLQASATFPASHLNFTHYIQCAKSTRPTK